MPMPTNLAPQVVVKFADTVAISLGQGATLSLDQLASIVGSDGAAAIDAIRQVMPDIALRRHFDVLSPDDLQALVNRAKDNDSSYQPPNFETFLEVVCPADFNTDPLITAIQKLGNVIEFAEAVVPTEPAGVVGTSNQFFNQQGYLFAATVGIGVQAAWAKGADGSGSQFIDIEHAWALIHDDLPQFIPIISGVDDGVDQGHGTAVLGVVAAIDNNIGVVGIAPATGISLVSVVDPSQIGPLMTERVGPKIAFAAKNLNFGDVLLLEVQQEKRPVELDSVVFRAIDLATRSGVVVVEAAGNAGVNLDNEPLLGDSGAIVVGACSPGAPHSRWVSTNSASNFGNRIDCHAWGDSVFTTGLDSDPVPHDSYFNFSGTSAAASIIAGVCLLIQNLRRLSGGSNLSPSAVRDILRDVNNCTESAAPFADRIAAMPDFQKIIPNQGF
jgi:hypothetical protein